MVARTRAPRKRAPRPPAATPERGEHHISLGGTDYLLRPSQAAIRAIETQTGASLLSLVRDGNVGNLNQDELGIIACELIRAGATDETTRHVGAEALGELIYEEGTASATVRLTLCLADAAAGGRTASGERKAATA